MNLPEPFLKISQRVGSDPLLVQGPGGNTSVKSGGTMWVKASGTELADALSQDIFVHVDCELAVQEIDGAGDGTCRAALVDPNASLRPSIETAFHALLPFRFVVHVHSIATICHACTVEGEKLLEEKLNGLDWAIVPYRRPGIPLTRAIRDAMGTSPASVYILKNHGLIVCGNEIDGVGELLDQVEQRLSLTPADTASRNAEFDLADGWHHLPEFDYLACDPTAQSRATAASYYPDHVVFLGPALPMTSAEKTRAFAIANPEFPAVLVQEMGLMVRANCKPSVRAMLGCLQDVLSRIPRGWKLNGLTGQEEMELLNWDAEKYRQALAAKSGQI